MAEWLDLLAPVVLDAYAERAWPETLVLDNTWFMVENRRPHTQTSDRSTTGCPLRPGHPALRPRWRGGAAVSAVDRVVGADLPEEPGPGTVVITPEGRVFQHMPEGGPGRRHWIGATSPIFGTDRMTTATWLELLSLGAVRIVWEPAAEAAGVPADA